MPNRKVVIVAAVNGGMQQDREGAHVPVTPEELAAEAARCRAAGAAIVHVHARDATRRNSGDPNIYSEIVRQIRAASDILIQTTNGIGVRRDPQTGRMSWPSDEERLGLLGIVPRQDLFGIAIGSCDFYNPEGGYTEETPYVNSPELLRQVIPRVHAMGSVVEFEVVEASMLHKLRRLAEGGLFDPAAANLWLLHGGGFGATPPLARNVIFSIDEGQRLFPNARWGVTATGRDQFPIGTLGLAMGCDSVRVGFEDNIYRPDGTAARHNHDLVADMVAIARLFGREPATPAEARAILGLRAGG